MADKKVIVTTPTERVIHWFLAISCLLLVITGLAIAFRSFEPVALIFGGYNTMITIHIILGLIFTIALFLAISIWKKDAGSINKEDILWMKGAGGYLWDAKLPEPYKFNAGQKMFFITVALYGLVMVVTGLILWLGMSSLGTGLLRWMMVLHAFGVMVLGGFAMVHIYLGTIGTSGSIDAVLDGKVTEAWAKTHMTKWYKEVGSKKKT